MFSEVKGAQFPALEREVAAFWRERDIFKKSVAKDAPRGEYVFYEGPPTANGQPALHHVLARSFKDLFPRFKTMQGFHVTRRGGWDTHGLPVEISVEKKLGLQGRNHDATREELEAFNRLCRESVWSTIQDWNVFTERLGFWVDLDDAYITYQNPYIESVWNLLKRLWEKGLVAQDYKVVPLSPRIATTLSKAELGEEDSYRVVDDPSVYVRFPVKPETTPQAVLDVLAAQGVAIDDLPRLSLVVWTTTPWTLPSNTMAAVHPELTYAVCASPAGPIIIAQDAVAAAALAIVLPLFLPLAVAVVAGESIAGEAQDGTLRYLLVRPVGRTRLLLAKLVAVTAFTLTAVVLVAVTAHVLGTQLFGPGSLTSTSLPSTSGTTLTTAQATWRTALAVVYVGWSMLGVAAVALFLSTLTDSPLAAALGAVALLVASTVLVGLEAAQSVRPYLPTRYWLAFVDLFRDLWRDLLRGSLLQAVYVLVFLAAAWANVTTKDITS